MSATARKEEPEMNLFSSPFLEFIAEFARSLERHSS